MNINFSEFDSIMNVVNTLLKAFSGIVDYLLMSPNDMLDFIGININLPNWIGGLTPMALMLGIGLPLYLIYQFLTWLLNLVT